MKVGILATESILIFSDERSLESRSPDRETAAVLFLSSLNFYSVETKVVIVAH
jgi:hypothetical protein